MDSIKFSSDFPDFIDEETLMKASLPSQQTHPHQFGEILPITNNSIKTPQITTTKQKKNYQENSPNKNQLNKNIEKEQQNHNQNNQSQTQENIPKINLDPTKIVNRTDSSHDSHQRQKQQRQKPRQNQQHPQQQQQQQHPQQQQQHPQQQHQQPQHQQQQHQQSQHQQQQHQQQQHQQHPQHSQQHQHQSNKPKNMIFSYSPDQDDDKKRSPKKNNKKNKDKNIKAGKNNNDTSAKEKVNNNNTANNNKVEQVIETIEIAHPTIFYSYNSYLSATFNSETQCLYTYDKSSLSFVQNQLNQKDPITSFILLDEGTYVYSTSQGVFVSSRIDGESFHPLPNITDIRPDYTNDRCHFFVLSDGNLYTCQYIDQKIQPYLLHKNVINFDFSKLYRLIVKKKGFRLYKRTDFKSFPVIKHDFKGPTAIKYFCDDDYIYEFSKGQVIPFLINRNYLKACEPIKNVTNVFSSDEVTIIINDNINNNNNNLSRIPYSLCKIQIKDQTYEFKQLPTCVIINDGAISIWSDYDSPPTWLQIPDLQEGQKIYDSEFIKETAQGSINLIKELNASYDNYLEKLNGLILQTIPVIDRSFDKLREKIKTLNGKIEKIEEIAMNTAATPQMCLNLYKKDVDRAFRAAAHYSINNLIALCGKNRFTESLQNNRISDETLIEIAEVFTDNLEQMGYSIVPYFVDLLLYFDPENEIFKARIKPLTSGILSATIALFPTVETSDPNYINLRRLAHIAMSLQNT